MYRVLEAELVRCGITRKELAAYLDIQYNTLNAKLRGDSCFTLDEAIKIKTALGTKLTIEELFERDNIAA